MTRAEQIKERLEQIEGRLQEVATKLSQLNRLPMLEDPIEWLELRSERGAKLGEERRLLIAERRRLEREYERLPKHTKAKS